MIEKTQATVRIWWIADGRSEVEESTVTEKVYDPAALMDETIDSYWTRGEPTEAELLVGGKVVSRWSNSRY